RVVCRATAREPTHRRRGGGQSDRSRHTAASAHEDLQLSLSRDSRSELRAGHNETLIIERRHTPGWVIVVCILFFPVGLLALLAPKRIDRGTVAVTDNQNGTVTLRMAGTFFKKTHAAINGVIDRGSTP
ncbi:MAG: hypothetical protein ACRDZ2_07440, partial [Ilumatobacteraceae bacterium]